MEDSKIKYTEATKRGHPMEKEDHAGMAKRAKVNHDPDVCAPIRSIEELWGFLDTPPPWIRMIEDLSERSATVVMNKHTLCHHIEGSTNVTFKRLDRQLVPRTLVCHDMKNGYLEDRYINSTKSGNGYTFYRWSQIDIFVYFSHHFITIPPLSWINVAHKNGVKILGTFITEWDEGKKLCHDFLKNVETMRTFTNALVDVTVMFKLDGWLLNIENPLENTSMLIEFVRYLTDMMHRRRPGSIIIWYDSIITDGTLTWQNELNEKNRSFFDVCDGIFLNYVWKEVNLLTSSKIAQHRVMDVYVGIDVFGRNTFGGGKFNCHIAAEKIRSLNMSMAIFAQGWTHESLDREPEDTFLERFIRKDNSFWRSLWPYLYTHPICKLFDTFFYIGVDKDNFKLHDQEPQLSRFLHSGSEEYENEVSTLKNQCNCLQFKLDNENVCCLITKNLDMLVYIHSLFICDIPVQGDVILYTFTKPTSDQIADRLNLILLVQENGSFRKIVCNSKREQQIGNNFTITHIYPCPDNRIINFDSNDNIPNNANLRCYHLKFVNPSRILEISGEIVNGNSIILSGIGIRKVKF